jgi:hypothetical protein
MGKTAVDAGFLSIQATPGGMFSGMLCGFTWRVFVKT